MSPAAPSVLYLSAQLPKCSETFVYRELFALRSLGLRVWAASVHAPETGLGETRLEALAGEAAGIYGPGVLALWKDGLAEAALRPRRALRVMRTAVSDLIQADDVAGVRRLKILWQALASLALARRVRVWQLTHIHAHMAHVPTTIAMYAAMQLGVPFSFTGHAADLFRDRSLLVVKLSRARFVACISRWHREFYQGLVARSQGDYPLIRCGVDLCEFSPVDQPAGNKVPLILSVGRLVPKKGFDQLLRALAVLRSAGRPFQAMLVGGGPEQDRLEALRQHLNLTEQVAMTGELSNHGIRDLLRRADLFVLPCCVDTSGDRDGIPVVLMEAMASGVPVISGDLPAIRELVENGRTGSLVDAEDVPGLARAIGDLLDQPVRRTEWGAAGRKKVETEFALDMNARRIIASLAGAFGHS